MKKRSRLMALLLALSMLISMLPASALAGGAINTMDDYLDAKQRLEQELLEPVIPIEQETEYTIPRTSTVESIQYETVTGVISETGENDFVLPIAGKLELSVAPQAGTCQWQISVDGVWANIVGGDESTLAFTYAMLNSALDGDLAQVRCAFVDGETTTYSPVATITVDRTPVTTQTTVTEEIAAVSYYVDAPVSKARALNANLLSDSPATYNVVINYLFENNEIASDPYTASLAAGSSFSTTVIFPVVQGYLPYCGETQQNSLDLNFAAIDKDYIYNVVYKPTNVNYTVIHYKQNLDDDKYTEAERETKQGQTNSTVPEVAKTYEGFYALLYEKPAIAADGSTVVEVYYDRYYYLMNFDLGGGYGVEPIYARYGAPIGNVGTPTKAGYTFKGWSLDGTNVVALPLTMPASNQTYIAIWELGDPVNYTVVYWRENANDSNYSFWGQVTKQAVAGTQVSGTDDIPSSITTATVNGESLDERPYFTYNAAKTNKNVVVKGDGTTIVNVYYYRNTYNLYFRGISGKCAIEEHTHGDGNCNSYLDCLQTEHTHNESCERILTCTIPEHQHTDECYGLTCGQEEHDHAVEGCQLICGKEEYSHTHAVKCYDNSVVGNSAYPLYPPNNPVNGQVYKAIYVPYSYIYINGSWYDYNGSLNNGQVEQPICGKNEGSHTHLDSCYDCGLVNHKHDNTCYGLICEQQVHTHTDGCYAYTCGAEGHKHDSSCYRPCTKLEHTHTNNCTQSRTDNVIYVVSAKYEQNIADVWPTADKFSDYTLNGWTIDGVSAMAVSKRVSMTADLCDTSDNLKYAKANSGGSKQTLYYMFESFDQTSAANGDARKLLNGVYYDSDARYMQVVNSGATNWGQKPIEGMIATGTVQYESNNTKVFLYYKRNRWNLMFNNSSDGIVKTEKNIMFEQPLANYKDSDGKLLSNFVPGYPSQLEPNAYEFKGWYTTPECYDGTEYNFAGATMPNANLTLYAKWAPVTHTVEFYLDKSALEAGTKLSTHPDIIVPHGSKADPTPEDPTNGSYTFVGWFYMDGGVEKAFDFANMPVNKDLKVYGKWSSNVLKEYTIYYKIKNTDTEIAAPTTGSGLAGITKTFEAKGGAELYADYQEGYFPVTKSHSMTIDINDDKKNVFTFWYVQKEAVPYTVKYLNKETGDEVATEKTVSDNRKAVVTETFVPVSGMMPDAYQKRLVVSVDENGNPDTEHNVIIFYYTEDTTHAYYKITHYTENLGTDAQGKATWTEYASSQAVGDIGTIYTAEPMTIPGFTYDSTVEGTMASGELTANGLELKLYYTRNSYPYEVRYLEQGTNKVLADPKQSTGKYGQVISESAKDIANYTAVAPTSKTLTISIEEGLSPTLNVITFYYTENEATINYEVVGPNGCGSVSPTSETLKVLTGTVQGSTPTANENFRFVGWYTDEACTTPVNSSWVNESNKLTPAKAEGAAWTNATYYAKFEYNLTTLTIKKSGCADIDDGQSFIFTVKGKGLPADGLKIAIKGDGSETISGLYVGEEYTITEDEGWSWRYTAEGPKKVTLRPTGNEVTISNTRDKSQWLDGDCYNENVFGTQGSGN